MAFTKVKETWADIKKIVQLSHRAQKQVQVLQASLAENQKDLAELSRHVKKIQYQNQAHFDRIAEVREKMAEGRSGHSKLW